MKRSRDLSLGTPLGGGGEVMCISQSRSPNTIIQYPQSSSIDYHYSSSCSYYNSNINNNDNNNNHPHNYNHNHSSSSTPTKPFGFSLGSPAIDSSSAAAFPFTFNSSSSKFPFINITCDNSSNNNSNNNVNNNINSNINNNNNGNSNSNNNSNHSKYYNNSKSSGSKNNIFLSNPAFLKTSAIGLQFVNDSIDESLSNSELGDDSDCRNDKSSTKKNRQKNRSSITNFFPVIYKPSQNVLANSLRGGCNSQTTQVCGCCNASGGQRVTMCTGDSDPVSRCSFCLKSFCEDKCGGACWQCGESFCSNCSVIDVSTYSNERFHDECSWGSMDCSKSSSNYNANLGGGGGGGSGGGGGGYLPQGNNKMDYNLRICIDCQRNNRR